MGGEGGGEEEERKRKRKKKGRRKELSSMKSCLSIPSPTTLLVQTSRDLSKLFKAGMEEAQMALLDVGAVLR